MPLKMILNVVLLKISLFCLAQTKNYSNNEIFKSKIFPNLLEYWHHKNITLDNNDTLQYFVNILNYKGINNYDIELKSKDKKEIFIQEIRNFKNIDIEFETFKYNKKDSTLLVEGIIKTKWKEGNCKNIIIQPNVFIGNIKDTISKLFLPQCMYLYNENLVYHKGKEQKGLIVLDSFPSLKITNFKRTKINSTSDQSFSLKAKVNEKSFLLIGLSYHYAEIFDLGKLIYGIKTEKNEYKIISKTKTNKEKYIEDIKLAETFVSRENYNKALNIYMNALKNYSNLFAVDLNNALKTAIITKSYTSAEFLSEKLVNKGVNINFFNSIFFDAYKKTNNWKRFKKKYANLNKNFNAQKDTILKAELIKLVDYDQIYHEQSYRKEITNENLDKVTSEVTDKLNKLINKHGFPTEEKIGVLQINDTILEISPLHNVLYIHSYKKKPKSHEILIKIIDQKSESLEFDFYRNRYDKISILPDLGIYKGGLYKIKGSVPNEDDIQKIKYSFLKNKHKFFLKSDYIIMAVDCPEEEIPFINDDYDFIIKLTDDWFFYEK